MARRSSWSTTTRTSSTSRRPSSSRRALPSPRPAGSEALALLEKGNFDLILLDVMMPEIDGFEVCAGSRKTSG